jgi:hypothetical protein
MSSIAEAFMKKCREQNRQRQARYLSNPENKKKALLRQKERYNHLKEMKNPKTAEMDHSALLNPNKEVDNSNFQFKLTQPTFVFKPTTTIKQPINLEQKRVERRETKIDYQKNKRQDLINQRRFS